MKSLICKSIAVVTICAALFSFSPMPGGEGFEISLNNKVMIQKFGNEVNSVQNIQLTQASPNDQLIIKYHHCGKVGKNRILAIKDGQNKTLKEFHYADAATPVAAMSLNVKDILGFKKGNAILKLFYSSSELPNGRILASF